MESNHLVLGVLIFIAIILGANLAMYAIARGATKSGDARWMNALKNALTRPMDNPSHKSMDELRKRMEELGTQEKQE